MANEIQVARQVSGKTLYAAVRNRSADVWDDAGQQFVVITAITWDDAAYPSRLKEVPELPPILYLKGDLLPEDDLSIAVVGTRKATA